MHVNVVLPKYKQFLGKLCQLCLVTKFDESLFLF